MKRSRLQNQIATQPTGLFEATKEALIKSSLPQSLRRMHTDLQRNMPLRGANPVRETLQRFPKNAETQKEQPLQMR